MITQYTFDVNTAQLISEIEFKGGLVCRMRYHKTISRERVVMMVVEGYDARREFFNHFGDDSSWPEGWWSRYLAGLVTKRKLI